MRLFAVAVARLLWDRMTPEQREATEVGERFADGSANEDDRLRCVNALYEVFRHGSAPAGGLGSWLATATVGRWRRDADMAQLPTWVGARQGTVAYQPPLLRDIFGNPVHPVTFDPAWRSDEAVSLARTMYQSRDFSAMPILADALQDVGCNSEFVLDHCRADKAHVKGCWVVDLVLGKE